MNVRVVSMPCTDLFEEQSAEYKESVLPKTVRRRVAVEALRLWLGTVHRTGRKDGDHGRLRSKRSGAAVV